MLYHPKNNYWVCGDGMLCVLPCTLTRQYGGVYRCLVHVPYTDSVAWYIGGSCSIKLDFWCLKKVTFLQSKAKAEVLETLVPYVTSSLTDVGAAVLRARADAALPVLQGKRPSSSPSPARRSRAAPPRCALCVAGVRLQLQDWSASQTAFTK